MFGVLFIAGAFLFFAMLVMAVQWTESHSKAWNSDKSRRSFNGGREGGMADQSASMVNNSGAQELHEYWEARIETLKGRINELRTRNAQRLAELEKQNDLLRSELATESSRLRLEKSA